TASRRRRSPRRAARGGTSSGVTRLPHVRGLEGVHLQRAAVARHGHRVLAAVAALLAAPGHLLDAGDDEHDRVVLDVAHLVERGGALRDDLVAAPLLQQAGRARVPRELPLQLVGDEARQARGVGLRRLVVAVGPVGGDEPLRQVRGGGELLPGERQQAVDVEVVRVDRALDAGRGRRRAGRAAGGHRAGLRAVLLAVGGGDRQIDPDGREHHHEAPEQKLALAVVQVHRWVFLILGRPGGRGSLVPSRVTARTLHRAEPERDRGLGLRTAPAPPQRRGLRPVALRPGRRRGARPGARLGNARPAPGPAGASGPAGPSGAAGTAARAAAAGGPGRTSAAPAEPAAASTGAVARPVAAGPAARTARTAAAGDAAPGTAASRPGGRARIARSGARAGGPAAAARPGAGDAARDAASGPAGARAAGAGATARRDAVRTLVARRAGRQVQRRRAPPGTSLLDR